MARAWEVIKGCYLSFYLSSFPQAHSQLTETHNRMCKGFDQHDQSILSESEDREISEQHFLSLIILLYLSCCCTNIVTLSLLLFYYYLLLSISTYTYIQYTYYILHVNIIQNKHCFNFKQFKDIITYY